MKNAFMGVQNLVGEERLNNVKSCHFLIIGIGGVGSWIAEFLIRSGAETITLVDLDEICVTNINRQIHALSSNIGESKVLAMKSRLLEINPAAKIETIEDFLTASSVHEIINSNINFVFDAIDSVSNKCRIIQKCKKMRIPFIIVGAAGSRIDPTKIKVKDLNRTINDKLLARVKSKMKKEYGYSQNPKRIYRVPTVFSEEVPLKSVPSDCDIKTVSNCESGLGSVGFVTSTFAAAAVAFAINKVQ